MCIILSHTVRSADAAFITQHRSSIGLFGRTSGIGASTSGFVDFSSPAEWETFYKNSTDVTEWHSSIPLDRIASYVPTGDDQPSCLMVGCGNSKLPEATLLHSPDARLTLLDTSSTCLQQLHDIYGSKVQYICGDALKLSTCLKRNQRNAFDVILDKGLVDALLCGDGWDGDLLTLFQEATQFLKPGGRYILVSYKLGKSTREYVQEIGETFDLDWQFDLPPASNNKVGISIGTKRL